MTGSFQLYLFLFCSLMFIVSMISVSTMSCLGFCVIMKVTSLTSTMTRSIEIFLFLSVLNYLIAERLFKRNTKS